MATPPICPTCGNNFLSGDCGHRNQASVYRTGAGGTLRDDDIIMAVIEAAKAWAKTTDGRLPLTGEGAAQDNLYTAIEALAATEGRE